MCSNFSSILISLWAICAKISPILPISPIPASILFLYVTPPRRFGYPFFLNPICRTLTTLCPYLSRLPHCCPLSHHIFSERLFPYLALKSRRSLISILTYTDLTCRISPDCSPIIISATHLSNRAKFRPV